MDESRPQSGTELDDSDLKISSEMSRDTAMYLAIGGTALFLLIAWPLSPWLVLPVLGLAYRSLEPASKWHNAALYALLVAGIGASLQLIKTVMPLGIACVVAVAAAIVIHASTRRSEDERGVMRALRDTAVWIGAGLFAVCGAVIAADVFGLHPDYQPSTGAVADALIDGSGWLRGTLGISAIVALVGMVVASALVLVLRSRDSANPGAAHLAGVLAAVCAFGFAVGERGERYRKERATHEAEQARIALNARMAETEKAQRKATFTVHQLHHNRKLLVNYAFLTRRVDTLDDQFKGDLYAFLLESSTQNYGSEARQRLARELVKKLPKFELETRPKPGAAPIEASVAQVQTWLDTPLEEASDAAHPTAALAAIEAETERVRALFRATRKEVVERFEADVWAARALQQVADPALADGAEAAAGAAQAENKIAKKPPVKTAKKNPGGPENQSDTEMAAALAEAAALDEARDKKRLEQAMDNFIAEFLDAYFPWPSSLEGSAPVDDVVSAAAWASERTDPETWVWSLRRKPSDMDATHGAVALSYLEHVAEIESERADKRQAEMEQAAAEARERAQRERKRRELEQLYGAPVEEDGHGGYYIRRGYGVGGGRSSGRSWGGGGRFGIRRRKRGKTRPVRLSA